MSLDEGDALAAVVRVPKEEGDEVTAAGADVAPSALSPQQRPESGAPPQQQDLAEDELLEDEEDLSDDDELADEENELPEDENESDDAE